MNRFQQHKRMGALNPLRVGHQYNAPVAPPEILNRIAGPSY